MTKTNKELRRIVAEASGAREELRRREDEVIGKTNRKLIGKVYRFRNSYGSGEDWWLYKKITGVSGRMMETIRFQICAGGKIEIEKSSWDYAPETSEEISEEEFLLGWAKVEDAIKEFKCWISPQLSVAANE